MFVRMCLAIIVQWGPPIILLGDQLLPLLPRFPRLRIIGLLDYQANRQSD